MEKKSVIAFLKKKGIEIKDNDKITYATKGENGIFWANPKKDVLISDWWIFLVDKKKKCLFLLLVPANSLREEDLRFRQHGRNSGLIQLLFKEEGGNIEDTSSKKNFTSWLYERFDYSQPCMIQKILFGAPGTGKSHKIDNGLFKNEDGSTYGLMSVSQDCKFRTTFHPDYDYAQFVGSYKPKKEASSITYSFVPQVFAKAYAAAWNKFIAAGEKSVADNQVYLVIEEINRGNCAQIFGDLFQLLDRKNGESEYPINADADFGQWLVDEAKVPKHEYDENGCVKIKLPPNFNILATMNTSDQSLFPMDSAFKRRFDWEYVPINYKHEKAGFSIVLGDKKYSWLAFLEKVNANIYKSTESEDKQMGEFFVKPKEGNDIEFEVFRSKVMFYLWDSVYKDDVDRKEVFRFDWEFAENDKRPVTFQALFEDDETSKKILQKMMENLNVPEK